MTAASSLLIWAIVLLITGGNALKCHECMSVSCNVSKPDCARYVGIIKYSLSALHYFHGDVPLCPVDPENEEVQSAWNRKMEEGRHCPEDKHGNAICVGAVLTMKTTSPSRGGGRQTLSSYSGFVVGCGSSYLLREIGTAINSGEGVLLNRTRSRLEGIYQDEVLITHCGSLQHMCTDTDYCLTWQDMKLSSETEVGKVSCNTTSASGILGGADPGIDIMIVLVTALVVIALCLELYCNRQEIYKFFK